MNLLLFFRRARNRTLNPQRPAPRITRLWSPVLTPVCALLFLIVAACDEPMGPDMDMSDVAVSAEQRLKDYRELSRYPDQSRPAGPETPELEDWPGMDKTRKDSARFSGWDGEEFRDGSLIVFVKLDVKEAGRYSFTTVLEEASSSRKLAVSTVTRDLPAGKVRVALEFYGLILREAGSGGPFLLKGLLGERLLNDADVEKLTTGRLGENPEGVLAPLASEYRTRAYPVDGFTAREYDSPEKRRRIEELEREVRDEARSGKK